MKLDREGVARDKKLPLDVLADIAGKQRTDQVMGSDARFLHGSARPRKLRRNMTGAIDACVVTSVAILCVAKVFYAN